MGAAARHLSPGARARLNDQNSVQSIAARYGFTLVQQRLELFGQRTAPDSADARRRTKPESPKPEGARPGTPKKDAG